ncbi:hypothetical protein PQJ75_11805 [Rhodoplanes sp. TEM]|uniref:Uncharacterized protein n=1 Tax=Rhodoplanes tepidamans TaxID=200616 RepID=A0ABT5JG47_RHOTP|nr:MULTISPECIES: hypothetical protein [Rhodoplanes]MDC7788683.1 hypothetical protein [Rhodoplanes tepidamans]MDC7984417.1 hypothetical protein [Rhodoplanes sp. TEM]MDQ0358313.1 hypothetical protein [Rhodoplanes tepidamans]
MTEPPQKTVLALLRRIFPSGTLLSTGRETREAVEVTQAPIFPTDVFAATALLLLRAGALNQLFVGPPAGGVPTPLRPSFENLCRTVEAGGLDLHDEDLRKTFQEAGKAWARKLPAPDIVQEYWSRIVAAGSEPIYPQVDRHGAYPIWWTYALALMIVADEACEGVGYSVASEPTQNWVASIAALAYWRASADRFTDRRGRGNGRRTAVVSNDLPSLCVLVDPDVVCVQPKVRTAAVGCTLRSYTQNLALLPPRGIVSTGWHVPPGRLSTENETAALNILIVPYPFKLRATWFAPTRAKGARRDDGVDGAIERG